MTNSLPGQWPSHGAINDMLKKGSTENLQSALGNSLGCKVSLWSPGKGGVSGTRSLEFYPWNFPRRNQVTQQGLFCPKQRGSAHSDDSVSR